MDFSNSSMEGILARLSSALEEMSGGSQEQAAIPYTLGQLLDTAIDNRAALLHINVGCPPMLRINEQLVPVGEHQLTRGDCRKLLSPVLTHEMRAELFAGNEVETYFPASGTGFKLSIYTERGNMSASIRRLRSDIPSLDNLGLAGSPLDDALREASGLIVITGSPRCGKINTLASIVAHLNATRSARIISLEHPIQFWQQNAMSTVIQREVGTDTQSFAQGVHQAISQDPDIIALTDIPDRDTAEYVLRAAAGGHLVIACIDASSSVRAVERLINTYLECENSQKALHMLSKALRVVTCQTLVQRSTTRNMLPVFEILTNNDDVAQDLRNGQIDRLHSIMRNSSNMRTLESELGRLVKNGIVDREEALRLVDELPDVSHEEHKEDVASGTGDGESPLMNWL